MNLKHVGDGGQCGQKIQSRKNPIDRTRCHGNNQLLERLTGFWIAAFITKQENKTPSYHTRALHKCVRNRIYRHLQHLYVLDQTDFGAV